MKKPNLFRYLLKNMKLLQCDRCQDIICIETEQVKMCACKSIGGSRTGDDLYNYWGVATPFDLSELRLKFLKRLSNNDNVSRLGYTKNIA